MIEKRLTLLGMIMQSLMLNGKASISVMPGHKSIQIKSRSNDQSKWLTELIDRSL
jgi:hypothetical protein